MSYAKQGVSAIVGWTTPALTYDRMRVTDAKAKALDADVRVYVTDNNDKGGNFRSAWGNWLKTWSAWYEKTLSTGAKLTTNVLNSDEIAEQATKYEEDLLRFKATYDGLKDPSGKQLPSNAPVGPRPSGGQEPGIPLWWFLAGAAVIGLGVFVYYRLKKTGQMLESRRQMLEEHVLPLALAPHAGPLAPALSRAATGRDAATPTSCGDCGRDLEVTPMPRAATKYYLSGE